MSALPSGADLPVFTAPLIVGLAAQGAGTRAGSALIVVAAAALVLMAGVVGGSANARRRHQ